MQLLPDILPILMVQCSLTVGYAILNAAGLSFIGLGIAPPTPEWGILVAEGAAFMISGEWWVALFPGRPDAECVADRPDANPCKPEPETQADRAGQREIGRAHV